LFNLKYPFTNSVINNTNNIFYDNYIRK
jgi:hypothetical protein